VKAVGQSRRVFNARHSARIPDSRYAGNAPLPALPTRLSVYRHPQRFHFGSSKREEGAPCTWPCALANSERLSSTSISSSTKTTSLLSPVSHLLFLLLLLLFLLSSSQSYLLYRFALPLILILPSRSKSLSVVLGTPRDLLAIRLIGKRGRPGLQKEISVAERNVLPRETTQRDRTVHQTESLANEPESPAAKASIAFLGVATFFNYDATLHLLRVPA